MYNLAVTAKRPPFAGLLAPRRVLGALSALAAAALVLGAAPRPAHAVRPAIPQVQEFGPEAKLLYRVAACGGSDPLPANASAKIVDRHCKELLAAVEEYKRRWLAVAMPFIAKVVPAGLPTHVVYPYAGGDLVTALAVYPDALEFTTISLESAGDPRGIDTLTGAELETSLKINRHNVVRLMRAAFSATTELAAGESSALPGQLILAIEGLVVHGYEPVSLRYFSIQPDGSIHYVTGDEIAAYDASKKKLGKKAERELRLSLFSNAELGFRKAGDASAPVKIYRHIAANLYDDAFATDAPLMKFLEARGKVAAMTKAASHLLWSPKSSHMRGYLLGHMVWMISDATGIPNADAAAAGFEQVTWGKFAGTYFEQHQPNVEKEFVKLWKDNPVQPLPFRFGYFDKKFQSHMLVTRPKTK